MVATKEEAESKKKFKGKKAQELTDAEVKELVFKLARLHHLV